MIERDEHGRELPPGVYVEEPARPTAIGPSVAERARAVRAAVRLMGYHGEAYAVSLACVDVGTAAGRALTEAERADVARMVREEMAR